MRISNKLEKSLIIGIWVAIAVFIVCGASVAFFAIGNWRNNSRLVDAQVEVYKAQAENVGKPVIYEQYYHSPND